MADLQPEPRMTVADTVTLIEVGLDRHDRRGVALLAKELDDAVLMSGGYAGALPSLAKLLQSRRFAECPASWQVLRAIDGNVNLLLPDEAKSSLP